MIDYIKNNVEWLFSGAGVTVVVFAFTSCCVIFKCLRKPKAKPSVKECSAAVKLSHAHNRNCTAEAILYNSGKAPCHITNVEIDPRITSIDTLLVSFDKERVHGHNTMGNECPLPLGVNELKRVYMATSESQKQFPKDEIPESVELAI
jgi:hypothetical protein